MQRESTPPVRLLGFLTIQTIDDDAGYIGSAMVTDQNGYPLEFRVLTPVKPTALQKVLFGQGLEQYIGIEMCGKKLVQGIQRKPSVLLTDRKDLLGLDGHFSGSILLLRRVGEGVTARIDPASTLEEGRLEGTSAGFQPIVWQGNLTSGNKDELLAFLSQCLYNFDLIEVFKRMQTAVELLSNSDPRYR